MRVDTSDMLALSEAIAPMLLEGDSAFLRALREQRAHVLERKLDFNGYGFYVDYVVDDAYRILNRDLQRCVLTDMQACGPGGDVVVGFQLFIDRGAISLFEGFPTGLHEWPNIEVEPEYVYFYEDGHALVGKTRFPEVVREYGADEVVVTRRMLDAAGGVPLPGWPPLCL